MHEHVCPICNNSFSFENLKDVPMFPFCSLPCKQQDLGAWLSDAYAVKTSVMSGETEIGPSEGEEEESTT